MAAFQLPVLAVWWMTIVSWHYQDPETGQIPRTPATRHWGSSGPATIEPWNTWMAQGHHWSESSPLRCRPAVMLVLPEDTPFCDRLQMQGFPIRPLWKALPATPSNHLWLSQPTAQWCLKCRRLCLGHNSESVMLTIFFCEVYHVELIIW